MKRSEVKTIHTVVFQDGAGGGNPCPVTLSAENLTTEQMQQMTKEFGVESAFLMKSEREDCARKARYLTDLRLFLRHFLDR